MINYMLLKLCSVFYTQYIKLLLNPKGTVLNERSHKTQSNCMGAQDQPIYTRSLMVKMAADVTMEYRRSILWLTASSKFPETADHGQR
jgi:hypothetical protein